MMYKRRIKLSLVVTALLTLALCTNAYASKTNMRLYGIDRYATSSKIALNGWTQSDYAVLASGGDYPDALCSAPLAGKYKAPILLTEKNSIPTSTLATITQLAVKNVFIIGGTGVISQAVQDQLSGLGIIVTRLAGKTRYDTDIAVAEQLGTVSQIAVVTGEDYADALSIAPIAVKLNMPIILVGKNSIPQAVKDYVASQNITKTYVIGKGTSINNEAGLPNVTEINGQDRYARNIAIISTFKSDLDFSTFYMATGENFADALSGSVLAGLDGNPLILVGNDISTEKNLIQLVAPNANIKILGGVGAVSDSTVDTIGNTNGNTTGNDGIEDTTTPSAITIGTDPIVDNNIDDTATDVTQEMPEYSNRAVPTRLSAKLDINGVIDVKWNRVHYAGHYNIYYSYNNVDFKLMTRVKSNQLKIRISKDLLDRTRENGEHQAIYFEVASVINGKESEVSNYVEARLPRESKDKNQ